MPILPYNALRFNRGNARLRLAEMSACGPEALLFPDGEALAFSPVIWKKASILL